MAAVKTQHPRLSLTMVVSEVLAPLIQAVPLVDDVIALDAQRANVWNRAIALARYLRGARFDAAVVSNPKKELHLGVALARIPVRIGYGRKWGCLLTRQVPDRKTDGGRHEVDYNLDLVRALGLPIGVPEWPVFKLDVERESVGRLLRDVGIDSNERVLAVHPWTSHSAKQWPIHRFRRLIQVMSEEARGRPIVLIGGSEEAVRIPEMMQKFHDRVVNLTGRLTLTQLAAVLARSSVLVSNDSGPVHLAAAVKTPTIVLFGRSDPSTGPTRWGPWGQGHTIIGRPSMDAITVEDVLAALAPFLHA